MWATITIIALSLIGIGIALEKHGTPKTGENNFWVTLISQIIEWILLYYAGIFDKFQ